MWLTTLNVPLVITLRKIPVVLLATISVISRLKALRAYGSMINVLKMASYRWRVGKRRIKFFQTGSAEQHTAGDVIVILGSLPLQVINFVDQIDTCDLGRLRCGLAAGNPFFGQFYG